VYENRLKHLEQAHHALDKQIAGLESTGRFDDAQMQELKKQKLHLRDQIVELQKQNPGVKNSL
jgi:uncharacterized protein YdcH (DUF465 family)